MPTEWRGQQELRELLARELGDEAIASSFAEIVLADALSWNPRVMAPGDTTSILAYTFGNRIDVNGNRSPGPVNAALADIAVKLHHETGATVYAQWEVAEAIGRRIAAEDLVSITPLRDVRAEPIYLSTGGVAAAVVARTGSAAGLGKVAVVAFRDHIMRCVDTSRRAGMDAAAPAGCEMPSTYDVQSGQPWTRSRLAYLLHDVMCRFEDRRNQVMVGA